MACAVLIVLYPLNRVTVGRSGLQVWGWLLHHAIWLSLGGLMVFCVLVRLEIENRLGVEGWDKPWWRYLLSGFLGALWGELLAASMLGTCVALPVLLPVELLQVYVLGPHATIRSAIATLPIVFASVSAAFTLLYLAILVNRKGNLVSTRDKAALYDTNRPGPLPLLEVYYFSVSTMVKASPQY
jgi:hypothetical protein